MTQSICASANLDPSLVNASEDGVARDNLPSHSGSQRKRKRAILITAGDPPNYSPLAQAKSDTWALRALLMGIISSIGKNPHADLTLWSGTFQYLDDDIVVMMKDDKIDKKMWPRRDNIVSCHLWSITVQVIHTIGANQCIELQKLVKRSSPGDHLFVYCRCELQHSLTFTFHRLHTSVSGHGGQVECTHNTETDGFDECRAFFDFLHVVVHISRRYFWLQWQAHYRQCELHHLSGTTSWMTLFSGPSQVSGKKIA